MERNLDELLILLLISMLQTDSSFRSVFALNDTIVPVYLTSENPVIMLLHNVKLYETLLSL